MLNNQGQADVRNVMTGKDGQVFIYKKDGSQVFLAECEEFTATISVTNQSYQPVGSAQEYSTMSGFNVKITLSEIVIRDDAMLNDLLEDLQEGWAPMWDFQGKARQRSGKEERMVFRDCVPDGDIDLIYLQPGETMKRSWTLNVNSIPEQLSKLI